jgi:hypothetical protein
MAQKYSVTMMINQNYINEEFNSNLIASGSELPFSNLLSGNLKLIYNFPFVLLGCKTWFHIKKT